MSSSGAQIPSDQPKKQLACSNAEHGICTTGTNCSTECFFYWSALNKTKWPRQVRELILDSDAEILDFWTFDEKNNGL